MSIEISFDIKIQMSRNRLYEQYTVYSYVIEVNTQKCSVSYCEPHLVCVGYPLRIPSRFGSAGVGLVLAGEQNILLDLIS